LLVLVSAQPPGRPRPSFVDKKTKKTKKKTKTASKKNPFAHESSARGGASEKTHRSSTLIFSKQKTPWISPTSPRRLETFPSVFRWADIDVLVTIAGRMIAIGALAGPSRPLIWDNAWAGESEPIKSLFASQAASPAKESAGVGGGPSSMFGCGFFPWHLGGLPGLLALRKPPKEAPASKGLDVTTGLPVPLVSLGFPRQYPGHRGLVPGQM